MYRPVVTFSLAVALSGCFFEGDHHDYPRDGTLTVDWTIEGSHATAACRRNGVDTVDIVISTGRGQPVDEVEEVCEAFEVSIDLFPDTYFVDAVLLDVNGVELTTTVSDRVYIDPGLDTLSAVDFPPDSFF
jgi:hypothetical protein